MLERTKSLLKKIQNYEDIPDRVKCIQDYYKGEDCYLLAAGPSLNKYGVDYIKDKIGDKLVIALKQSIGNFYDITDFHVLNFTNFEPYDYTDSNDTITVWEVFEQYHPQMILENNFKCELMLPCVGNHESDLVKRINKN